MALYPELVRKARELHNKLGEQKFRELYEKHPSSLATDLGVIIRGAGRNTAGASVLQAFHFYPLGENAKEAYERILELHKKRQAEALHSGTFDARPLRILEARGLIRLKKGKSSRLMITEVFKKGAWKRVS